MADDPLVQICNRNVLKPVPYHCTRQCRTHNLGRAPWTLQAYIYGWLATAMLMDSCQWRTEAGWDMIIDTILCILQVVRPWFPCVKSHEWHFFDKLHSQPSDANVPSMITYALKICVGLVGISVTGLNARSLLSKLDDVKLLVSQTEINCLGLYENWLNFSTSNEAINIRD